MRMMLAALVLLVSSGFAEAGPIRSFLSNPNRPPLVRVTETGDVFGRTFGVQVQTRRPFVRVFLGTQGGAIAGGQRKVEILGRPFGYQVQARRPFVRVFVGLR